MKDLKQALANGDISPESLVDRIKEQAREIERLMRSAQTNWNEFAEGMKAQPSGVVFDSVNEAASILRNMIDSIGVHGNYSHESALLFLNQALGCLDEVAHPNHPTSADLIRFDFTNAQGQPDSKMMTHGEMRQRYSDLLTSNALALGGGGSTISAGDERAAFEAWYLDRFYMGDKQCGLEWLSTEPCGGYRHQHPAEQWAVWQARAALSANHSEQVRHMVPAKNLEMYIQALEKFEADDGVFVRLSDVFGAIAEVAAPSAGNQGGDV